jgi:hypothetical protein
MTALILSGCSGMISGVPLDLPSWSPGPGIPAGIAEGILRFDGDCVRLDTDEGVGYVVVWPAGTRLREELAPPVVVDAHERVVGTLGDRMSLPGAPFPPRSWADQRGRLIVDVPAACRDRALWFGVPISR